MTLNFLVKYLIMKKMTKYLNTSNAYSTIILSLGDSTDSIDSIREAGSNGSDLDIVKQL
ncbi:hypothetical protein D3C80_2237110 [compost metagenome]